MTTTHCVVAYDADFTAALPCSRITLAASTGEEYPPRVVGMLATPQDAAY
jgi:hypothetical protein